MGDIPFIVPFGKGGASDRAARCFARSFAGFVRPDHACAAPQEERSANRERGPLSVENIPGAGGHYGLQRANALAQAGTPVLLLSTPTTHILLPARLGDAAAPHGAFRPLLGLGSAPNVLCVSPLLGVRSVDALIAMAKRQPLAYASAGTGQTIHAATALFCLRAGISMDHRPYDRGSATAYGDLAAGRIDVYFDNLLGCREMVAEGRAVALAVSDTQRSPALPDIPTLAECGMAGHALDVWLSVFVAHGGAAFNRLDSAGVREWRDLGFAEALRGLGLTGGPIDAAATAAQMQRSMAGWRQALAACDRVAG